MSAVEFAFVAGILMMLLLGLIEFGRLMMVEQVLTNAARDGCRTGVMPGSAVSDIESEVNNYLDSSGVPHAQVTITVYLNGTQQTAGGTTPIGVQGDQIQVKVSVPFNNISWLAHPLFLGGKTLSVTALMSKEANNT